MELAQMPTYYVMDLGKTMPQTVAPFQLCAAEVLACKWLTEPELDVYTEEYGRTGFQGALQAHRVFSDPDLNADAPVFGQDDRCPVALHRREERLGHLFGAGRGRFYEDGGDDEDEWHRADRRRRSLDPTRAAGPARHAPARLYQGGGWGGSHQRLSRRMSVAALEKTVWTL